ncbi:NACHT, LRR and PYD domains-containing protein 3-like [Hemiscyllium ocellatum]|uniref:NACHT, LRR and PYD domains-containing protein 3-like n=1 Tax=Hemiscyllium ocellatum TaxID=170820 RepID=UPI0029675911|nr:NACHT, LRR and PYD domains-containing protein 3-like [Hemiscyllium ocellatum]
MKEQTIIIFIFTTTVAASGLMLIVATYIVTQWMNSRRSYRALVSEGNVVSNLHPDANMDENETRRVAAVTDLREQHKDFLHKKSLSIGQKRKFRRIALSEGYTRVIMVTSASEQVHEGVPLKGRRVGGEEFWRRAEKHQPDEIPLDRLVRKRSDETGVSGTTVIVAPSGFGKSTTLQQITHSWATGEMYPEIDVIFPFKVQQLNSIEGETCLNELVLDYFPHCRDWLQFLWKEPEKILFMLDDVDLLRKPMETPSGNAHGSESFGPERFCEVSQIVRCLIQGRLLKGCSVMATSSPWRLQNLGTVGSHRIVNILGFSAEVMEQYFQRCCLAGGIPDWDETVHTMCHNPGFCSALALTLEAQLTEGAQTQAMATRTRALLTFLTWVLDKRGCEDAIARHMLLKLGGLAYWGVCTETVVFGRDHFDRHSLPLSNWISTLMMEVQGDGGVGYVFTHPVLKDFVAALYKSQCTPADQVKRTLAEWSSCPQDRFKLVSRFLIGLCSPNAVKETGFPWGKVPSETASNVSDWLRENFSRCVQDLQSQRNQKGLLGILDCLLEFGDASTLRDVLAPVKTLRFAKCPLQPADRTVLSKAFIVVQEIQELDLDSCGLEGEGFHQLEQVLHKCKVLSLNKNKLGDSGVTRLSHILKKENCRIQRLFLKSNNLTDGCVETLISALRENTVLLQLDIGNDDPNGDQANRLTDQSIPALSQFIQSNTQVTELRLSHNQFSAEGLKRLERIPASNNLTVKIE